MSRRDPGGVRPSVWIVAAAMVAGCGLAVYLTTADGPSGGGGAASDAARAEASRARPTGRGRVAERASGTHHASRASGAYEHHDWSRETELQRRMALGLPGPSFWREAEAGRLPRHDPQLLAMWRSFRHEAADGEAPELPFEPTATRARLVDAEGEVAASASSCDVRVLPVRSHAFNCVVRVTCDGEVLYPDARQRAGYVPCEIEDGRPVRAVDTGHTSRDGDPLVSVDLRAGTVTVEDRDETGASRYRATLRLDG
jgi:hypothetical protein